MLVWQLICTEEWDGVNTRQWEPIPVYEVSSPTLFPLNSLTRGLAYFHRYRVFLSLITIDFFVFSMYMLYFLVLVFSPKSFEFIILCCILPMALLILVFAVLGIRRENHILMYLFVTGIFFLLFYNGFLLSRIFDPTLASVSMLIKAFSLFWGRYIWLCYRNHAHSIAFLQLHLDSFAPL
jgi:hypothetical protein